MTEKARRSETNYKFTIEQIGRLEKALLASRGSDVGLREILDTTARDTYKEILRIRSRLDAALGFNPEETSEMLLSLYRPPRTLSQVPTEGNRNRVVAEGKLRAVDMDIGIFYLRQRLGGKPNLSCKIPREIQTQALECLARGSTVMLEGVQNYYPEGVPGRLDVENLYEAGTDD